MALNMRDALKYDEGIDAGVILGRQEGRQEEKFDTARRLKAMGLSLEQIVQATGLSIAAINAL